MGNIVKFNDLSTSLKTLVILGWIATGMYALIFLVAFIQGILIA